LPASAQEEPGNKILMLVQSLYRALSTYAVSVPWTFMAAISLVGAASKNSEISAGGLSVITLKSSQSIQAEKGC